MTKDYRNERVGLPTAAQYLGVPVGALRAAVTDRTLLFGVPAPEPWFIAGNGGRAPYFRLGDVIDTAEEIQRARRRK